MAKTSLSVGNVIRDMLISSKEVESKTNKIFPVAISKAVLQIGRASCRERV